MPPRRIEYNEHGRVQSSEDVEISGSIDRETEKAFKFYDGTRIEWIPKSYCIWDQHEGIMTMPFWLAKEKGFI